MNEGYKTLGTLKSVLSNRGLRMHAKMPYKRLYNMKVLYQRRCTKKRHHGMTRVERRKVNILEIKCSRSLVGRYEWMELGIKMLSRRAAMERELASRVDHEELRWFDMWRECTSTVWL